MRRASGVEAADADPGEAGSVHAAPRRVFLSHTSELGAPRGAKSFVAAAVEAVLRAEHAVTDMAYFTARETEPSDYCRAMVARADIYAGIIGLRYGSPVRDRPELSYTELEFETASRRRMPRLIFLIDERSPSLPPVSQSAEHRARQEAFRGRLPDAGVTIARVASPTELELKLYQALVELGPRPEASTRLAEALLASLPTDALPPHAPLPPGSRMLLARNPLFVGRGEDLYRMAAALKAGGTLALGQVVAATGLGGLGKTQLAVEFVHRYGRYFAGGVFWLSFASPEEIPVQVASCAGPGALGLATSVEALSFAERLELVIGAWQSALPRLVVFDNCEDETLLDAWRPSSGGCRVLVTSRRAHWSPTLGVTALALDRLHRPESVQLLRRYRDDLAAADPELDAVARALGDLPLALHLAGSFLRTYRAEVSPRDYLAQLRTSEVLDHASLLGRGLDDSHSPTGHIQNLAQTFAVSFDRLDVATEVDRVAVALLARMACLAPGEPVPRNLLLETLQDTDQLLRADGLRRLDDLGLVESGDEWLRMHRLLVHFVRREGADPGAQSAVEEALIECGRAAATRRLVGAPLLAVIPHLVHASGTAEEDRASGLRTATGQALKCAGDLAAARPLFEEAVAIYERLLGPDHPDTAASLHTLAWLLREQGDLAAARPLLERALEIRERVLGPDHLDTAASLHNLAWMLHHQGELTAARTLCERALEIRERTLGPDHPDTVQMLTVLAWLLRELGEHGAARPLLERALEIQQRVLGTDHPDTAWTLYAIAYVLREQAEHTAARPRCEQALEARRRVLGEDHLDVSFSLTELAELRRAQGELAAAASLYEHAVEIRDRALAPGHPYTAQARVSLAIVRGDTDDPRLRTEWALARPHFERALAIREKVLGAEHPYTALGLDDLGTVLLLQGERAAARPLLERALAIRVRALGPDHPDTATTRRRLAEVPS